MDIQAVKWDNALHVSRESERYSKCDTCGSFYKPCSSDLVAPSEEGEARSLCSPVSSLAALWLCVSDTES